MPVLRPALDRAWAVDAKTGVESREVADGVFVVTDGVWQSAFAVTDAGVVVFDAPETYAAKIRAEIAAVTNQPVTTLVYTHAHNDHIGGSAAFKDIPGLEIVALNSVAKFLAEKNDPDRLKPTRTFDDQLVLTRGGTRFATLVGLCERARIVSAPDDLRPGARRVPGHTRVGRRHALVGSQGRQSERGQPAWPSQRRERARVGHAGQLP